MSFVARFSNPLRVGLWLAVVWGAGGLRPEGARAQLSPAFTYEGQLQQSGMPENATACDFQFGLFAAASGGTALGTQAVPSVSVTNGLFTVVLNNSNQLGTNAFSGSNRYLEVDVCCPAGCAPSYVTLSPRQQLTATPYALYAPAAGSASGLSCSGCVTGADLAAGAVTSSAIASGTIQQSNLGFTPVLSVGATSPLVSSGGQNPNISLTIPLSVANGGTGAGTATTARASLGAAASGANSDITSLSGITGNITLPESTSATAGNILKGSIPFIHDYPGSGSGNTFVGEFAGNFSLSGVNNTAVGEYALAANTTGAANTAVGLGALGANTTGSNNAALGQEALLSNTTGADNTALGQYALAANTTGSNNAALGQEALFSNTTGADNTALGQYALAANTTGANNAALGQAALQNNTSGADNTAVGQSALVTNTMGQHNTALGRNALQSNTTASGNTAVGAHVLYYNDNSGSGTAINNTAVGQNALDNNLTGANNIAIGFGAGTNVTKGSNDIYIGAGSGGDESNTIRIGTTQTATFIAGIYKPSITDRIVYVNSDGQLGTLSSSARFKDDIEDMGDNTSGLLKLRPVRFRYKQDIDPSGLEQYGLVAEEVATVYPELVSNDAEGRPYTVRYQFLAPMLLNEVQKQARQITAQARRIVQLTEQTRQATEQKRQISEQSRQLNEQAQQIATLQKQVEELVTLKAATAALQARVEALDTQQTVANRRSGRAQDARPAAF